MHDDHEALYLNCENYGPWIIDSGHLKGPIWTYSEHVLKEIAQIGILPTFQSLLCNILHNNVNIEMCLKLKKIFFYMDMQWNCNTSEKIIYSIPIYIWEIVNAWWWCPFSLLPKMLRLIHGVPGWGVQAIGYRQYGKCESKCIQSTNASTSRRYKLNAWVCCL